MKDLTREIILTLTTPEKIFSHYLYTPSLKGSFTNPFRVDNRPGCTFYYSKTGKLYFVDWAWNRRHYDCFNVVMEYYKCGLGRALEYIYDDIQSGAVSPRVKEDVERVTVKKNKLNVTPRAYTQQELDFWNVGGLSITQDMLQKAGIYCVDVIWENDWVIDNCKMTFAYVVDNIVQQVYFPKHKGTTKRRFINREGFTIGGYNELPFFGDHVVIGNSKKCNFFMTELDIIAMYVVNESVIITEDMYETLKLQFKRVFFLGDNDFAGRRLAVKYKQKFPDITILLFPQGTPKDFTDNLEAFGMNSMIELRDSLKEQFEI